MSLSHSTSMDNLLIAGRILADRIHMFYDVVVGRPVDLEKVEKVQLVDRFGSRSATVGTLYVTTTHLIFVATDVDNGFAGQETWILHSHIASIEKGQLTAAGCPLHVRCKNFLIITFIVQRERDCHDVFETLTQLSQPVHIEEVYAFQYVINDMERNEGWDIARMDADFQRLGLPDEYWTLSDLNVDYSLCETYPKLLFVPKTAPTKVLLGSSKFRSRNRLPVLSYLHQDTHASICRCSQPLAGFSARCDEDEVMFQHILKTNPRSSVLYVVDTRPMVNAIANKAAGKGFENESYYSNIRSYFFAIENIHVMRSSLQKLVEVCSQRQTVTTFQAGLDSCGWLRHVRCVLEAGSFVADSIVKGITCVVHCSDGWDRTAQAVSLACLLLDPFYRTVKGFQTLIEKDWLAFGHKFSDRCGLTSQSDLKEQSPIFTQFLDCVWQIAQQFPIAFQFNERFLLTLHDHVYSCQFGTFLGNCDKDRVDLRLSQRTYSLWGYMSRYVDDFINPLYDYKAKSAQDFLRPDLRPQLIKFWSALYNRFDVGFQPREPQLERICMAKDHLEALEDHSALLTQRIAELRQSLGKPAKSPLSASSMNDSGQFMSSVVNLNSGSHSVRPLFADDVSLITAKNSDDSESGVEDLMNSCANSLSSKLPSLGSSIEKKIKETESSSNCVRLSQMSFSTSVDGSLLSNCPEVATVAMCWKSLRETVNCSCGTYFLPFMKKNHCYHCGNIFCSKCVDSKIFLPGLSSKLVPVCKKCKLDLKNIP